MGTALPPSGATPATSSVALQHFIERRRERFISTFQAQCDELLDLIDQVEERGARGPLIRLRQRAHRLRALARVAGFVRVGGGAADLERIVNNGATFDAACAREIITGLHERLENDLIAETPPAVTGPADVPVYTPTLRILLVDDHAMLRGGLRSFLSNAIVGATFGEADDSIQALDLLSRQAWDVALLDISLPGRNGLDLLKDVKRRWPRLPVLVLSAHREEEAALRALKAGADGYLTKQCAPEELVKAIRKIVGGGRYVSPALAEQLAIDARHDHERLPHQLLSDREYDVMCRIALGKTVSEIANEMSLSVKTISTYRSRVLQKLRVRNNAEIVQYALKNRLVC